MGQKLGFEIGLFVVPHTYGRQLNRPLHIRLSVPAAGWALNMGSGGRFISKGRWSKLTSVRPSSDCYGEKYAELNLSSAGYEQIRDYSEWYQFLEAQFRRRWKIHFAKKIKYTQQNRQLYWPLPETPTDGRPTLRHYTGGAVVHHYYDHCTQRHRRQELSQEEMLLLKVYAALEMEVKTKSARPSYAILMKQFTNAAPYQCMQCRTRMVFSGAEAGSRAEELLFRRHHRLEKDR